MNTFTIFSSFRHPNTKLDYNKLKRQLIEIKNLKYPKIPKTIKEIERAFEVKSNCERFGMTLNGMHKLYMGMKTGDSHSFLVFGSQKVMDIINKYIPRRNRNLLIDGTFKIIPRQFYQLVVVCIEFKNDVRRNFTAV